MLLAVVLVAAIVYPRKNWENEAANRALCRARLVNLDKAVQQYRRFNGSFSTSAVRVMQFTLTDPGYLAQRDSLVVWPLRNTKKALDSLQQMQALADTLLGMLITAPFDSTAIDSIDRLEDRVIDGSRYSRQSLETVGERMAGLPNMPMAVFERGLSVITRKDYFFKMEVVKRMVTAIGNRQAARAASKETLANLGQLAFYLEETLAQLAAAPVRVDSLSVCPTVGEPLQITLVGSGDATVVNISCSIDSTDMQRVQADFFKSRIGALKIFHHGHLAGGVRSWAAKP
ncbi:MAG: hypothetical protein ALAOOOJD_04737 [bacterium]|nr:hypothetical protein [bacterium]